MTGTTVLARSQWQSLRDRHRDRVDTLIGPHRDRGGRKHPVVDFLFTYYSFRPAQLLRWHPGFGVTLEGGDEYADRRGYHRTTAGVTVDPAFLARRRDAVEYAAALTAATAGRPPRLSCFGLHEWAMVYRSDETRHPVPLRLGADGTDRVVESAEIRCSHYDAFRFFTPEAVPLNIEPLTRADQVAREQPGCLHANMDLYKLCYKLSPLIDSDLTVDCFELAWDARELDMRASPYDLRDLGYEPVPIETPQGRAAYVREQSALAERAAVLRELLTRQCRALATLARA
ncbi:3-methyladenine DNA glycosylase [Rhodococcus sp. D2-41]|uniref:3-methyladenine DNA glycosylase n=1 Tax=Speluncibacter jeojiensis TaxID=2710754 RepID=UPI00240EAAD8|nr:3-methyladenine DNA glycosylase [Rhodococcus sp. D2-41]MDG3010750.1 3-methyladenine DNA glycosylase [Rhodococcus sp. D2-41]